MIDYYKILEVSHRANTSKIRKAYRKRALELHPDVNDSDSAQEEFVRINEAYSVLKNAISKIRYDKLYRFHILKEDVRSQSRFQKKENSRTQSYSRKSNQGYSQAESDLDASAEEFEKRQKKSSAWDGFWNIFGIFAELFSAFM